MYRPTPLRSCYRPAENKAAVFPHRWRLFHHSRSAADGPAGPAAPLRSPGPVSAITGAAMVAGIIGRPVTHSLSPVLHNAWIEAAGLNAVYAPLAPPADGFRALIDGLRGGVIRGVNVTIPFKEAALAAADELRDRARLAGAAN
eukprot:gene64931-88827_t